MRNYLALFWHLLVVLAKLSRRGGARSVIAENLLLKQQLMMLRRSSKRSPKLTTQDRFILGCCTLLLNPSRITKAAVIIKPSTLLTFHKALVKRKYHRLFSAKRFRKPGPKGPSQEVINVIVEMKQRNPTIGYGRIAMQIYQSFGIEISCFAVGRVLRKNKGKLPSGDGPSWLTFLGHMKDSLWSVDLFRCESITLKSHWVMVVMDQFSRQIIGFAVHTGDCDGIAYCRMFNKIIAGKSLPKYLSSDNDPLFLFHRWVANLSILEIEEIKSVPCMPTSHPFVERVIGSTRRECLDQALFFNKRDLQNKLDAFQQYFNATRGHSSLGGNTPIGTVNGAKTGKKAHLPAQYNWLSCCGGSYQFPVSAQS